LGYLTPMEFANRGLKLPLIKKTKTCYCSAKLTPP